jgi:hypothetical protein
MRQKRCLAVKGDLRPINKISGGRSVERKKSLEPLSGKAKKSSDSVLRVSNRIRRGGFTP